VCIDACKQGIRRVVMQEDRVICYESRKLNAHEINYVTRNLELDSIVHSLKMWRNYLQERSFFLMMGHSELIYLFDHPKLNAGKSR
jgi:hypothetical protein